MFSDRFVSSLSLHQTKVTGRSRRQGHGVSTGFVELYSLGKGMVFLESFGFLVALLATMIDASS